LAVKSAEKACNTRNQELKKRNDNRDEIER